MMFTIYDDRYVGADDADDDNDADDTNDCIVVADFADDN